MNEHEHSSAKDLLPTLGKVIAKYQISAKKSLGQHFLLDKNLTDRIAIIANVRELTVIEIGAGPGGLTRSLLQQGAKRVIAVEKDPSCLAALQDLQRVYSNQLTLVEADALDLNLSNLSSSPYTIVANLPYNISTALLIGWLQQIGPVSQMTLMFQKEVADRLVALPSTKNYGRLTIMTQWLCEVKLKFNIHSKVFVPPPRVVSSVVTLVPRAVPLAPANWINLEKVTSAAFNQRRKMLRSSLRGFHFNFLALEIDPTWRAENLTIEQFCRLARNIKD